MCLCYRSYIIFLYESNKYIHHMVNAFIECIINRIKTIIFHFGGKFWFIAKPDACSALLVFLNAGNSYCCGSERCYPAAQNGPSLLGLVRSGTPWWLFPCPFPLKKMLLSCHSDTVFCATDCWLSKYHQWAGVGVCPSYLGLHPTLTPVELLSWLQVK